MNRIYPDRLHQALIVNDHEETGRTARSLYDFSLFMRDQLRLSNDEAKDLFCRYVDLATGPQEHRERFAAYGDDSQMDPTNSDTTTFTDNASAPQFAGPSSINTTLIGSIADYHPLWYMSTDITYEQIEAYRSAMKFDTLWAYGVFGVGDSFSLEATESYNSQTMRTTVIFQITGSSRPQNGKKLLPNLEVWIGDIKKDDLPACNGSTAMEEYLKGKGVTIVRNDTQCLWKDIYVYRQGHYIGTLQFVKKAFHFWRDLKDQEACEKGQHFRSRRPPAKGGKKVIYHKGMIGNYVDGVFVPEENQGQYRASG
ncbi:hypothetical protein ACLMJK_009172 [Lecanora helva]